MTAKCTPKTQITLTRSEKSLVRYLLLITEHLSDFEWSHLTQTPLKLTSNEAAAMNRLRRKLGMNERKLE